MPFPISTNVSEKKNFSRSIQHNLLYPFPYSKRQNIHTQTHKTIHIKMDMEYGCTYFLRI